MAGKVYISFLGTSNYVEFVYNIDGKESSPTRFIQEALAEKYCKDWGEGDAILIFATATARKRNWQDNGHKGETNPLYNQGLDSRLKALNLNPSLRVECIKIDEVEDESDIWNLFATVNKEIKDNHYSKIYFDITHAFRYIPMFAMSLFNYSQFVNGTEVVSVKYAKLDGMDNPSEIRETPLKDREIQTVLDLTSLVRLQEYTQIASDLENYGKAKELAGEIIENEDIKNVNVEKQFTDAIRRLDEYISTIQITKIKEGKFITAFKNTAKNAKKNLSKPVLEIVEMFEEKIKDFCAYETWNNVEAAINWAKNYDMLIQAYALAEEYIIMRVAEHFSDEYSYIKDPDNRDKHFFRKYIGSVLAMPDKARINKEYGRETGYYPNETDEILSQQWILNLRIPYDNLRQKRNSLAHGNGSFDYKELEEEFESSYLLCKQIIYESCS